MTVFHSPVIRQLSRFDRLKRWVRWRILGQARLVIGCDFGTTESTKVRCLHWPDGTIEVLDEKIEIRAKLR